MSPLEWIRLFSLCFEFADSTFQLQVSMANGNILSGRIPDTSLKHAHACANAPNAHTVPASGQMC